MFVVPASVCDSCFASSEHGDAYYCCTRQYLRRGGLRTGYMYMSARWNVSHIGQIIYRSFPQLQIIPTVHDLDSLRQIDLLPDVA